MANPTPEQRAAYIQDLVNHARNVLNEIEGQLRVIMAESRTQPAPPVSMMAGVLGDEDTLSLPVDDVKPKEMWAKRLGRKENPIAFVRRVYAPWIGRGLTRAHIRVVDRPLYRALGVWLHRHPDEAFADVPPRTHPHADLLASVPPERHEMLRKMGISLENRRRRQK